MTDKPVRVRFAPSPTGSLHIGGVRTALFNWLFARHHGGVHVLRIEDTDQNRLVEGAIDYIIESFAWFGLEFDEGPHIDGDYGPYIQSERLELYRKWCDYLLEEGHAYKAFETPEELTQISEEREKMGLPKGYDGRARNLTPEEVQALEAEGRPFVVRFKMPREGRTICDDLIRGKTVFENRLETDRVLMKADGFPTYHLAHVVDDHLMQISHVTRGIEWLPSLPLHWHMWEAFGWEKPNYVHLPLIMNPDGSKMSKRKPYIAPDGTPLPTLVHDYIEGGYLPDAIINFLTNIGWNFGDNQEIFTFEEATERFDLAAINKANAAFPLEKLISINQHYIAEMDTDKLAELLKPIFEDAGYTVDMDLLKRLAPHINTRIKLLTDAPSIAGFLFTDYTKFEAPPADWMIHKKMTAEESVQVVERAITEIENVEAFEPTALYAVFKALAKDMGLSNSKLFTPIRIGVAGQKVHPPLFETMELLGRAETIRRLRLASEQLQQTTD